MTTPSRLARFSLAVFLGAAAAPAGATTFTVLHDFRGPDGSGPMGGLAIDAAGTLYGTTIDKGAHGGGTLFALTAGKLVTLHDFGAGDDGSHPYDDTLLLDVDGTLYGSTQGGGAGRSGTLFSWRSNGGYARLYAFPASGEAGKEPRSGLAKGPDGELYGSASTGGDRLCRSGAGCGTIYRFDPATRTLKTLHVFDTGDGTSYPWSTPTLNAGSLLGTTMGVNDSGGPFIMRRDGSRFAPVAVGFGATQFPSALARDGSGRLWGTSLDESGDTQGTIYSVDGGGEFSAHFSFTGRDGAAPYGRLLADGAFLYGTTAAGGKYSCGTVFRYPRGASRVQTLHDFDCTDGNAPMGGLVTDGKGTFYGTTSSGGAFQNGTVFRIRP